MPVVASERPRAAGRRLAVLGALYFAQGLPFGVQVTVLPLLLRERGASLAALGFSSALAAPWLLKALWAPLVDRYFWPELGPTRSWVIPMQAMLVLLAVIAAQLTSAAGLALVVLLMNACAATQDIAVDALAVRWLRSGSLGHGNAVQVIGYKVGMLTSGGLLVWAVAWLGWSGLFWIMAGLMAAVLWVASSISDSAPLDADAATLSFRQIASQLANVLRAPGGVALVTVVCSYKLGEALADSMWKPLLLDRGFSASDIGLWTGSFGMVCSLLGSLLGGVAVERAQVVRPLLVFSLLRVVGIAGEWWVSVQVAPSVTWVLVATCLEHALGGALTTVLFALMMRATDARIGASHFALLAALEAWGKLLPSVFSGLLASAWGYSGVFGLSTGLSLAFALFVQRVAALLVRNGTRPIRQSFRL